MRPHPRISETVKWGGLVAALLLAFVWLSMAASTHLWTSKDGWWLAADWGWISVGRAQPVPPEFDPAFPWAHGQDSKNQWWMYGGSKGHPPILSVNPLHLAGCALAAAIFVWMLDMIANRRMRPHLCKQCRYDRTGLAPGALCPECGESPYNNA